MPESTLAGVITAIATVIIATGGLVGAVTLLLPVLRQTRRIAPLEQQVAEVHTIVNQQRTDMQRYTAALVSALRGAGIEVPVDQSLPHVEGSEIPNG